MLDSQQHNLKTYRAVKKIDTGDGKPVTVALNFKAMSLEEAQKRLDDSGLKDYKFVDTE